MGIDYFSSPYDFDAIDMLEPFVPAYKIGSGDITWDRSLAPHGEDRETHIAGNRRICISVKCNGQFTSSRQSTPNSS